MDVRKQLTDRPPGREGFAAVPGNARLPRRYPKDWRYPEDRATGLGTEVVVSTEQCMTFAIPNETLAVIAEGVARSLGSSLTIGGGHFIRTPMLYPSGSSAVIRIDGSDDRFFVTDNGMGYDEALMFNAAHGYAVVARTLIRDTEIGFDSRSFFVAHAAADELVGVVGAIANYSQRAVIETVVRHEARKKDADRAMLLHRLDSVFGTRRVEKDVTIRGSSTVDWEVTARIQSDNIVSIFDYARPHKNSVSSAAAKFHDIARLDVPPRRIISVRDYAAMGNFVGLLSQAANVIELEKTPDEVLRRLAA